jgi:hypothetical protein
MYDYACGRGGSRDFFGRGEGGISYGAIFSIIVGTNCNPKWVWRIVVKCYPNNHVKTHNTLWIQLFLKQCDHRRWVVRRLKLKADVKVSGTKNIKIPLLNLQWYKVKVHIHMNKSSVNIINCSNNSVTSFWGHMKWVSEYILRSI